MNGSSEIRLLRFGSLMFSNRSLAYEIILDSSVKIYRSKGLLAHLLKRRHYKAAKYLDFIPEIINAPDYAGSYDGQIELVKVFKDNIFLSIKLDETKDLYYVATLFDVSESKIEAYCKSGRLKKLDKSSLSL